MKYEINLSEDHTKELDLFAKELKIEAPELANRILVNTLQSRIDERYLDAKNGHKCRVCGRELRNREGTIECSSCESYFEDEYR